MSCLHVLLLLLGAVGVVAVLRWKKTPETMAEVSMTEAAGLGCLIPIVVMGTGGMGFLLSLVALYDSKKPSWQQKEDVGKALVFGLVSAVVAGVWVIIKKVPKRWI